MASGISSAAGALSNPMLEQLTTQDCWGPSGQLQLRGQGLQLLPPSACAAEPHTSKQQSATSRLEKKLNLGRQTPCFRLDKVCPFPQGIAHSHLIASDGVSPHSLGRNKMLGTKAKTRASFFHGFHIRRQKQKKSLTFSHRYLSLFSQRCFSSPRIPFPWKCNGAFPESFEEKKSFGELPPSPFFHIMQFHEPPLWPGE